jgi:hypothetical protein
MPKSGRPHDQLRVPFPLSLVSWVCLVCFFSDLFALSHRSIVCPATTKSSHASSLIQCQVNFFLKRSKTRHHGFLETGLHPDRVRVVFLGCHFCCRLWCLVRRRCCKAKLEESFSWRWMRSSREPQYGEEEELVGS